MKTIILVLSICLFPVSVFAGTISGSVKFSGTAPENEILSMSADPTCVAAHSGPVRAETVIVNSNGTLKNVFVYVKEGLGTQTFPVPAETVTIDQKGCQYNPHVFGMQVGQSLEILNSDPTLHNVHSMAEKSKQFNLGMPIQGMKLKKKFEAPEIMVKLKCDVHPWMSAFIGILNHPFFGVSDDSGNFEIKDLPAGEYTIEAWHEKYGTQTQKVTVADDAPVSIEFAYNA